MSARRSRQRFATWIITNGGSVFDAKSPYEFIRFRGGDGLCIVYRNRHGDVSNFQGALCREAWRAFEAKGRLDLSATVAAKPKNVWCDRAEALAAIIEVRTGARSGIAVRPFARAHNLTARFLVCFAVHHGLAWERHRLMRRPA